MQDYREEYTYIQNRRQTVLNGTGTSDDPPALPVSDIPPNLTGLAFSGGGIRSATFHLGILEALHDMKTLPKIDYLSTVSGGSYIAGWMLAHLGRELDDAYGNLVQTPDKGKLLDPHNDFVTHLRHHAGLIKEGGFWEGPKLIWGHLWRLLPYYIWDLGLHLKTPPDIGNQLHLFTPYQHRIELTYLRGKQETSSAISSTVADLVPSRVNRTGLIVTTTISNSPGTTPAPMGWATFNPQALGFWLSKPRQKVDNPPGLTLAR